PSAASAGTTAVGTPRRTRVSVANRRGSSRLAARSKYLRMSGGILLRSRVCREGQTPSPTGVSERACTRWTSVSSSPARYWPTKRTALSAYREPSMPISIRTASARDSVYQAAADELRRARGTREELRHAAAYQGRDFPSPSFFFVPGGVARTVRQDTRVPRSRGYATVPTK